MKKMMFFLVSVFLIWGCSTTPSSSPAESGEKSADTVTEKIVEKPAEPVMVDVQVPHLLMESRLFRDGSVDTWIEYNYLDNTDVLISEKHYDSSELLSSYVYENSKNGPVKKEEFTAENKSAGWETYEYDGSGFMIKKTAFDSKGNPLLISGYEYNDDGDITKLSISDGSDALLSFVTYSYTDGLLMMSELFDAGGKRTNYYEKEYDAEGNLVTETDLTDDGEIEGRVEYSYENGYLVLEEHKNRSGGLVRKFLYENDENGSPVKITLQNRKGITLEFVEKSYFYTTEQVEVE